MHLYVGVQFNPNALQGGAGSGLGLWVSKGFMEQHHGTLKAESEGIGKGCRFTMELPAFTCGEGSLENKNSLKSLLANFEDTELTDDLPIANVEPFVNDDNLLSPVASGAFVSHILIVDDAPTNRKMLARLLTSNGFTVAMSSDGKECVDHILTTSERTVDLILMDFEMPVMNGPTATKRLRDGGVHIPIVGLTGNVLEEDKKEFMGSGANDVLHKPLCISKFQSVLNKLAASSSLDNRK